MIDQNAVATMHKFPNPGGTISTKNVLFPIQGVQFWLKMSYFQVPRFHTVAFESPNLTEDLLVASHT